MSLEIQVPYESFMHPAVSRALSDLMLALHHYLNQHPDAPALTEEPPAEPPKLFMQSAKAPTAKPAQPAAPSAPATPAPAAAPAPAAPATVYNQSSISASFVRDFDVPQQKPQRQPRHLKPGLPQLITPNPQTEAPKTPVMLSLPVVEDVEPISLDPMDPSLMGCAGEGDEQWQKFYRDLRPQAQQLLDLVKTRKACNFSEAVTILNFKSPRALPPILAKMRRDAATYTVRLPYEECIIRGERAMRWIASSK